MRLCVLFSYFFIKQLLAQEIDKPSGNIFPGRYNNSSRICLGDWLITGDWNTAVKIYVHRECEYPGYNGFYNNLGKPESGAIDQPLLRRGPVAYSDGTYTPSGSKRENPLTLSKELLAGDFGTQSVTGKNALIVFFGQQVVEEILDSQRPACPPEYFNIKVPPNHTYLLKSPKHSELPFLRTRFDPKTGFSPNNPRQQINEITPYIDGGLFYGTTKQWCDQLRTYANGTIEKNGRLAASDDGLFPAFNDERLPMANPPPPYYHHKYIKKHETANVARHFKLGNPRGNENTFLLSFGIMWFRWHNYIADILHITQPNWSNDKIFNEARKWVIASQQNIIAYEWLPEWTSEKLPPYNHYDPSIDPQIDQFFQAAAFRFGHTLVVPGVYLRDYIRNNCKTDFETLKTKNNLSTIRTCNSYWRPNEPIITEDANNSKNYIDIDRVFMGMSVQLCEKEDNQIVDDLREHVFGPLEFPRRDLMALNIQRGRDHGLPDYNTARRSFGLKPMTFKDFQFLDEELLEKFIKLYNNSMDDVDVWVGGILETNKENRPGELFRTIILDQFKRIRDGDRFWFENIENGLFTQDEIDRIKSLTIYDILMAVTKMDDDDLPRKAFNVATDSDLNLTKKCKLKNSTCRKVTSVPGGVKNFTCYHLHQLNSDLLPEQCVQGVSYDYFSKSESSFIATFTCTTAIIVGWFGIIFLLMKRRSFTKKKEEECQNHITRETFKKTHKQYNHVYVVKEWIGPGLALRRTILILNKRSKSLSVNSSQGEKLRSIDFKTQCATIQIYEAIDAPYFILKCSHNYDLVAEFSSRLHLMQFMFDLEPFLKKCGNETEHINTLNLKSILRKVATKADRQKLLERFYRIVFANAFKIESNDNEMLHVDEKEIVNTELTIFEFSEALSMRSNDQFVVRMFNLIDKDQNGFISFREFVDLLVIFAKGTKTDKAKLLFDLYDINGVNFLSEENFTDMLKSFMETIQTTIDENHLKETVHQMLVKANLTNKPKLYFDDFLLLIGNQIKYLSKTKLIFNGLATSNCDYSRDQIESIYVSREDLEERFEGHALDTSSHIIDQAQAEHLKEIKNAKMKQSSEFVTYIELNSKLIFWCILYSLVLWAIFAERVYYYYIETEHTGLRRVAGWGIAITRGTASAMMFSYSSLLATMCRNLFTSLRNTTANVFLPFNSYVQIHTFIGISAFLFTLVHIIGHAFNMYHFSTQTADDLTCLFRNYYHATHELPKFYYWCWQTITGVTGMLLTVIWGLMYSFSVRKLQRDLFAWFWYTHNLYPIFYLLLLLHGAGRLIQAPYLFYYLIGPLLLFIIDCLVSISRKKIEISVLRAEILPSNVTMLEVRKPDYFSYKSGQWVLLACLGLSSNEYHPFTISSAPHEDKLRFYIRAVGPWTKNVRSFYENSLKEVNCLSKIFIDGPFGEGIQDWDLYDISILIGGGIGVTPFASILKDLVNRSNNIRCKRVYFIWVSRTQKQFEWFVDIIREIEKNNDNSIISCHIFITQFFEKFDLRTTFLYICERHYQRISNRSLFTNLKAVTHFGRPSFDRFFATVCRVHPNVRRVGVFSCGPSPLTLAVDFACHNHTNSNHSFEHHCNNF